MPAIKGGICDWTIAGLLPEEAELLLGTFGLRKHTVRRDRVW